MRPGLSRAVPAGEQYATRYQSESGAGVLCTILGDSILGDSGVNARRGFLPVGKCEEWSCIDSPLAPPPSALRTLTALRCYGPGALGRGAPEEPEDALANAVTQFCLGMSPDFVGSNKSKDQVLSKTGHALVQELDQQNRW